MYDKNLNDYLQNIMKAKRADDMLNSEQLNLGELILKLEAVTNKELPIVFDYKKYKPTGLDSWRGSYCELSIQYDGGGTCYEQPKDTCKMDEMFGYHAYDCPCGGSKGYSTSLPESPKVKDLLEKCRLILGKYVVGYKGGDFTMGKTTPVWVANYGESAGFRKNKNYDSTAVVDILETKKAVVIVTKLMSY